LRTASNTERGSSVKTPNPARRLFSTSPDSQPSTSSTSSTLKGFSVAETAM
jgi:hypothetical protein